MNFKVVPQKFFSFFKSCSQLFFRGYTQLVENYVDNLQ